MLKSLMLAGATLILLGASSIPSDAQVRSGFRSSIGGRVSLNPQPLPPRTLNRFR